MIEKYNKIIFIIAVLLLIISSSLAGVNTVLYRNIVNKTQELKHIQQENKLTLEIIEIGFFISKYFEMQQAIYDDDMKEIDKIIKDLKENIHIKTNKEIIYLFENVKTAYEKDDNRSVIDNFSILSRRLDKLKEESGINKWN